jgi:hypothetical protein
VTSQAPPERVTKEIKAYASRALNGRFGRNEKRWARHGSMGWLWDNDEVYSVIRYVVREQGVPMSLYIDPSFED